MHASDRARLRARYLLALGLVAPACGPATPSTTAPTTSASTSTSATTKSAKGDDDGPTVVGDEPKVASSDAVPSGCGYAYTRCMPAQDKGSSSYPAPYDACPSDYYSDNGEYYDRDRFSVRETKRARLKGNADACCYRLERMCYNNGGGGYYGPVPGRPLRDASTGEGVVAPVATREDWSFPVAQIAIASIPAEVRAALAASWLDDAADEHASVAAFSVVSLQLLALGAPADLLAGVHAAAADEIDHARLAYAVASAYAGAPRGPSSLDVSRAAIGADLVRFARETFRDGCFGETVASLRAREGAALARDSAVATLLARIADDEERHAELAWRIVGWAMRVGGEAVVEAVREEAGGLSVEPESEPQIDLSPYGVLGAAARASIARAAIDDVVLPCLDALVASYAPATRDVLTAL